MKLTICILVNKLVTKLCKLFGKNGSVLPASIVWDYFKGEHILNKVKLPKYVIAVTGSSGKGSTTDMIYRILSKNGYDVCYNSNGSNGVLAAMTLILNNCKLNGEFKHDVLLLECDERHLKLIFDENKMTHLIITNVTRDQPSRNGHPDMIFKELTSAIGPNTKLFLNADDPQVNKLKYERDNQCITFGLSNTSDDYQSSPIDCVDYAYCPFCKEKLNYKYYHYGHIGNYSCPNKDFERGKVDFEAKDIDYKNHTIKINTHELKLEKDVLYAIYYYLASYALCKDIINDEDKIINTINNEDHTAKRGKVLELDNRKLTMLESKNENNLSYYQSIKYITNQPNTKTIILGFDNVSRRYKFNDLSWLWDVDFELLNNPTIDKIVCIGRFRYDVLTRLQFANIPKDKIIVIDDLTTLIKEVKTKSKGDIYTMVCFDMTANILNLIKEEDNNENN